MPELVPGQRVELAQPVVQLGLEGPRLQELFGSIGGMLVAVDANKASVPDFPALDIASRETRPGAGHDSSGSLMLDTSALPVAADRLYVLLYFAYDGPARDIADFGQLTLAIGEHRVTINLAGRGDTAIIAAEIYRRGGHWRIAANGQGFVGGMGALQSALGISFPIPPRSERIISPRPPHEDRHGPGSSRGGGGGPPPPGQTYTGSGFAVDDRHILTNAHVVDGARRIEVASDQMSATAEIVFVDPRNDIALLRVTEKPLPNAATFRDGYDLHLGEDITVLGFPLQGLLGSGPQATTGNVSALCGIGNDSSVMQFSAPIASGNSGGPILDEAGHVVGLVYSSLNKDRIREGGSNAENINFGVKGVVVRAFLSTAGISPRAAAPAPARSRAEMVREARSYLFRIKCET